MTATMIGSHQRENRQYPVNHRTAGVGHRCHQKDDPERHARQFLPRRDACELSRDEIKVVRDLRKIGAGLIGLAQRQRALVRHGAHSRPKTVKLALKARPRVFPAETALTISAL